ncbi:MAG TPA: hypothetical protein VFP22_02460 [Candidatus Limnocylindrales bacterium]|nr:hypothetical protein [Candidatus Limnocylindrales bacterium]
MDFDAGAALPSSVPVLAFALPSPLVEPSDDAVFEEAEDLADALRSFFAQPDPLNTIVGATNPFRTSLEWQTGHVFGPSAWMPWITSKRWPQ